ncbi:hypothetical protein Pma05_08480 [Plantactinospora mayteni]|uniref:Molecular chaperone DnaJ n=1 Tax=Plantactinospora mayteni TaxID=566021 RepID=A0ABQ4EHS5_9ACTN|nr:hypothetical protein Pma05_08480 [Plantactinospora mayteni]
MKRALIRLLMVRPLTRARCPQCQGSGIYHGKVCPTCGGKGTV